MVDATPERRRGRQLPTMEELRIWRNFVETTETRTRSSALAAHIGWERSRLSHHLGRMERRGLIRREECATVPRGSQVLLTPVGAEAFQRATFGHLRTIRELFVDALTPDQLRAAGDIAAALREHLGPRDDA
ncbi:MarR family winged helix-turn-helix transcriptional regulator [Micromonospora sp. NPDC049102]|uniref:MarR family winged helix-turn-helix transcriptional regulator n=1 Tax=Micromonospora sp. NPDC049102 TaxID=3364265 RepID=UPI00371424A1